MHSWLKLLSKAPVNNDDFTQIHSLLFVCIMSMTQDYINCAEIWVEFTCRHFTVSYLLYLPEASGVANHYLSRIFKNFSKFSLVETGGEHGSCWHYQTHDSRQSFRGCLSTGMQKYTHDVICCWFRHDSSPFFCVLSCSQW